MRNRDAPRFGVLLLAAWLGACSSTTVIRSNPDGARVYLDGQYAGQTPLEVSDSKVSLSTTSVRLEKEGFVPQSYILKKNERINVVPLLGAFLIVPILWILQYRPEHAYDLLAEGPAGPTPGIPPTAGSPPTASTPVGATAADPVRADAINEQGKALYSKRDYPAAVARFREAIALSSEARFYFNLCAALDRLGHDDEALQACGAVYTNGASDDLRQRTDQRVKAIRAKKK